MQWEYRFESLPNNINERFAILENLGQFGWELVSVDQGIAYCKRPVSVELTCSVEMTEDRTAELAEKIAHELDRYMLGNR